MLSDFRIDTIFDYISWHNLFYLKKLMYPKLIRMLFANMHINLEPRIFSHLQNKCIEFDCETLDNILGISNEEPRVFEVKIILTIVDFMYDEVIAQHTSQLDFTPGVKIKSALIA